VELHGNAAYNEERIDSRYLLGPLDSGKGSASGAQDFSIVGVPKDDALDKLNQFLNMSMT
jgi:hypothetical protein